MWSIRHGLLRSNSAPRLRICYVPGPHISSVPEPKSSRTRAPREETNTHEHARIRDSVIIGIGAEIASYSNVKATLHPSAYGDLLAKSATRTVRGRQTCAREKYNRAPPPGNRRRGHCLELLTRLIRGRAFLRRGVASVGETCRVVSPVPLRRPRAGRSGLKTI